MNVKVAQEAPCLVPASHWSGLLAEGTLSESLFLFIEVPL